MSRTSRIQGWALLALLPLTQGCSALLKAGDSTFAVDHPDSASHSIGAGDSGVPDARTSSVRDGGSIGTRDSGRKSPSHPDASRSDVLTPVVDAAHASPRRHDASTRGGGVRDAGSDGRAPHDADARTLDAGHFPDGSSGRCDPNGAFGLPELPGQAFAPSSDYDNVGFTLSADGLTAYFASTRLSGNYDLFVANRVSPTDPFDEAEPLAGPINTSGQEREPSLSPDGSELFFTDQSDLFVARRGANDAEFGPGMPLDGVNTSFAEGDPYIAGDGKSLYFTSNRNDMPRIYVSTRDDAGHFGEPRIVLINAPDGSDGPVVSHDQLTLVVRSGLTGLTWVVKRTSTAVAFDLVSAVQIDPTLNVRWPVYLSGDGCTFYFVAQGQHRTIWMTTRSR